MTIIALPYRTGVREFLPSDAAMAEICDLQDGANICIWGEGYDEDGVFG